MWGRTGRCQAARGSAGSRPRCGSSLVLPGPQLSGVGGLPLPCAPLEKGREGSQLSVMALTFLFYSSLVLIFDPFAFFYEESNQDEDVQPVCGTGWTRGCHCSHHPVRTRSLPPPHSRLHFRQVPSPLVLVIRQNSLISQVIRSSASYPLTPGLPTLRDAAGGCLLPCQAPWARVLPLWPV